jgi:hypothetical protein
LTVCSLSSVFQDIIKSLDNPIKKTGHLQILRGNLAPEGSVAKITGKEGLYFSGNKFYVMYFDLLMSDVQLHFLVVIVIESTANINVMEHSLFSRSCTCI